MKNTIVIASIILGVSLILSIFIYTNNQYSMEKLNNTLEVTGSATKTVESDLAKLRSSFSRIVKESGLKEGYAQMSVDQQKVIAFLTENGITEDEYEIYPVSMYESYQYNKTPNSEIEYSLTQQVIVTSIDIEKIQLLSKKTEDLINQDVIYQSNSPEYYYTKLPDERIALLPDAVLDAQKRAQAIAESTDERVGTIKSASMGVVQVMQPDSIDVSSYGTYDTSTIEKEIMITVRASFTLY